MAGKIAPRNRYSAYVQGAKISEPSDQHGCCCMIFVGVRKNFSATYLDDLIYNYNLSSDVVSAFYDLSFYVLWGGALLPAAHGAEFGPVESYRCIAATCRSRKDDQKSMF